MDWSRPIRVVDTKRPFTPREPNRRARLLDLSFPESSKWASPSAKALARSLELPEVGATRVGNGGTSLPAIEKKG